MEMLLKVKLNEISPAGADSCPDGDRDGRTPSFDAPQPHFIPGNRAQDLIQAKRRDANLQVAGWYFTVSARNVAVRGE